MSSALAALSRRLSAGPLVSGFDAAAPSSDMLEMDGKDCRKRGIIICAKVEETTNVRRAEREEMKSKILSDPHQVELWFDKEIEKLGNISVGNRLAKIKL